MKQMVFSLLILILSGCWTENNDHIDEHENDGFNISARVSRIETNSSEPSLQNSLSMWESLIAEYGNNYKIKTIHFNWANPNTRSRTYSYFKEGQLYKLQHMITDDAGVINNETVYVHEMADLEKFYLNVKESHSFCKDTVLTQDPIENNMYVGYFGNGILSNCTYSPHNLADSDGIGIKMDEIYFGEFED